MKYIIMCGGTYKDFEIPKHLTPLHGEPLVCRTIRLLRQNGVTDIAISANDPRFEGLGVPVLRHKNEYTLWVSHKLETGIWVDGFYLVNEPVCYLFGDVVFSPQAIKTIVEKDTKDVDFFASTENFGYNYLKPWAEPFGFKVQNVEHFHQSIALTKQYLQEGKFRRHPVAWELWQVISGTPLNRILENYTIINDYTCDLDKPDEINQYDWIVPKED